LAAIARAEDPILEWTAIMIQADAVDHGATVREQPGPILSSRAFAMTSAAMYDAFNSIENIGTPYLTVAPDAEGASAVAAVAEAAHDTLIELYPAQSVAFDAALVESLARVADGPSKIQGIAVGRFVATRMLETHAKDGAADINNPSYVPTDAPGFHQPDPTNPNQGFCLLTRICG
jgi:vanadium chloroperoxidase